MLCNSAKLHLEKVALARRCFLLAFLPRLRFVRSRIWVKSSKPMRLWGVSVDDAFGHDMIGVLLQPSLPSTNHHKATGSGTGAFLLQTLSQSRVMIGFGNNTLPCMEGTISFGGSSHSQVANTDIHTCYIGMGLWCGVYSFNFQGDQQVELLTWFVIPELCRSNFSTFLYQGNVFAIARVGNNHTSVQCQDAHVLLGLEAIVFAVLIGQGRRDVLGWFVQALVAFLGMTSLAVGDILFDLRPQAFVGSSDLSRNGTRHLGRQMKTSTDLIVGAILQSNPVAHLAVLKRIAAHIIERITIGQLHCPQGGKLLMRRMQFEFGRYHCFHASYCIKCSTACQRRKIVEGFPSADAFLSSRPMNGGGHPERIVGESQWKHQNVVSPAARPIKIASR